MSKFVIPTPSNVIRGPNIGPLFGASTEARKAFFKRRTLSSHLLNNTRVHDKLWSDFFARSEGYHPCRLLPPLQCTVDSQLNSIVTKCPPFTRSIPSGSLQIKPLGNEEITESAILLTRAFLNSPGSISSIDANTVDRSFCQKAFLAPPKAIMLVAILTPNDPAELGPGRTTRLVGLTYLSLSPDSRPKFPNAKPPNSAAYLSSMAVDKKYRRQGIARMLIEVCEELCRAINIKTLTLHAWSNDPIAQKCYQSCDFTFAENKNSTILPIWKTNRVRILMKKELTS